LDAKDLQIGPDGHFEIVLSQQKKPGNWLRLDPASNAVLARQTFLDRKQEQPAQLKIEPLGSDATPEPPSPARLQRGLVSAGKFVEGTATVFANWAQSYLKHANQLPPADQDVCQRAGG